MSYWNSRQPSYRSLYRHNEERRKRLRSGRKFTKPMRMLQQMRDVQAKEIRKGRACRLDSACAYGGAGKCARKAHRYDPYFTEPLVEIQQGEKWTPIMDRRRTGYGGGLTWKDLRQEWEIA